MNIKVVIIVILTIIALLFLTLYTFGPLAKGDVKKMNPVSLKPADSVSVNLDNQKQSLAIYHNKDKRENFYTLTFPVEWKISSTNPGDYEIHYNGVTGYVKLLDVPDNTTLQLYLLGQVEPKLKKELKGYKRTDYRDIIINGSEGFQLTYEYEVGKEKLETFTDFITGVDNACTISFTSDHSIFPKQIPNFKSVIYTFRWESN